MEDIIDDIIDPKGMCCAVHNFKPVTHVIFDLDGTIIDTESTYFNAISKIASEYDKEYTEDIQMKLAGSIETVTARIAIGELELPLTVEEFLEKFHEYSNDQLPSCPLMKGSERAVLHLHSRNIPIALATSSPSIAVELKFKNRQELYRKFHHVVCGTDPDMRRGKPAPDIFLICAGRFPGNPPASKCLVFEDSVNGVKGALAAGMQVVMIPDRHVPFEEWKHATMRLDSFDDMAFGLFGLPPYPDDDEINIGEIALIDELGEQISTSIDYTAFVNREES